MKSVFIIALLVAVTFTMKTSSQSQISMTSAITKLNAMKNNQWKDIALDFIELATAVESPVSDLLQAFQDFNHDLGFKAEIEEHDFNVKEAEHDEWEAAIRARIAHAEKDIADATHQLNNILYPNKANYEKWIEEDYALIAATEVDMETATRNRHEESAANAAYVEEATLAVSALNDCLVLLQDMPTEGASFIQITKTKKSFQKLSKALKKTKFGPTIAALIKLADFVNPEMMARLVGKFTEVRNSLQDGIAETLAREAEEQAAYEAFMENCQATIDAANERIVNNKALLAQCIIDIANMEAFRAQREADLAVAEQDLADELARWATEVAIYEKLVSEMNAEFAAVSDIIDIFVEMFANLQSHASIVSDF